MTKAIGVGTAQWVRVIRCTRHYAIYRAGGDTLIVTARTLKEAEKYL